MSDRATCLCSRWLSNIGRTVLENMQGARTSSLRIPRLTLRAPRGKGPSSPCSQQNFICVPLFPRLDYRPFHAPAFLWEEDVKQDSLDGWKSSLLVP